MKGFLLHRGYSADDFATNPPRWSGYTIVNENLYIPTNDALLRSSWVSPSNVEPENSNLTHLFDYTSNPGSVTYIGDYPIVVECIAHVSVSMDSGSGVIRYKYGKNGTPENEPDRFMNADVSFDSGIHVISSTRYLTLIKGEYIDFYLGCDTPLTTIKIERAEWKLKGIAKISDIQSLLVPYQVLEGDYQTLDDPYYVIP